METRSKTALPENLPEVTPTNQAAELKTSNTSIAASVEEKSMAVAEEKLMSSSAVARMEEIGEMAASETVVGVAVKAEVGAAQSGWRALFNGVYSTLFTHTTDTKQARLVAGGVNTSSMNFFEKYFPGFKQNMTANLGRSIVLFSAMPVLQNYLQKNMRSDQKAVVDLMSFVGASMIEGVAWTPISYANFIMRIKPEVKGYKAALNYAPTVDTIRAIGKGAFWGGIIRNPLFAGPFFWALKSGEEHFISPTDTPQLKLLKTLGIGAASGVVPAFLSYPFDVIQKKMMQHPEKPFWEILSPFMKEKGVFELWKGGSTVPLRMAGSSAAIAAAIFTGDFLAHKNPMTFFGGTQRLTQALPSKAQSEEEVIKETASISVS